MKRRTNWALASLVLSMAIGSETRAYEIQYSWSGTIVPTGANDPWSIGVQGQPFSLSSIVSSSAPDLSSSDVQFATFNVDSAQLAINGQDVPYVGNGVIDFTDNSSATFDLLRVGGNFQRSGQTLEIESLVDLSPATFAFTQNSEPPPLFSSTTNVESASCCGGAYTLIVDAGSAVKVVPEPANIVSCLFGLTLMALRRR